MSMTQPFADFSRFVLPPTGAMTAFLLGSILVSVLCPCMWQYLQRAAGPASASEANAESASPTAIVPSPFTPHIAVQTIDRPRPMIEDDRSGARRRLESMRVYDLQAMLREMRLPISGITADLVTRILSYCEAKPRELRF
eukprot:6933300-Pyramimonas_sp.AAC.1